MCLRSTLPVLLLIIIAAIVLSSPTTVSARSSQSFSDALEEIQNNLNYEFQNIELLRRAMTDSSYSEENDKDFGILAQSQSSSSFSLALETLQKHLNYEFKNIGLLRRAMTHSSYSEENNKAFGILGQSIIETTVALRAMIKDIDISSKDLNDKISEVSKVDTSCAVDGMRLGLQNVVRVSSSTDSSTSSIVCGAFRAIFAAVALDTGKSDDASNVFWMVHGGAGKAVPITNQPKTLRHIGYKTRFGNHMIQLNILIELLGLGVRFEGKTKNLVRLRSFPFTVPADLETYQNSAPETNQKHLSCDCYQISAQPRLSSSFSASLETLQKHLNYGIFRNVVLSTPCNTTRLFVRTTKKFSVLVEEQIETTMWIPLVLLMECGQMLWTIALDSGKCDDAHNVFWAVHGGDGKGFISEGKIQSVELWLVSLKGQFE
ncbi:protein nuclear fusion defective 2 [Tanacetum coccineum]